MREQRKLAIMDVARRANVPRSCYYRYDNGENFPNVLTAIRIAHALDTTVEELWKPNTELQNA